jgi:hypothetical protein
MRFLLLLSFICCSLIIRSQTALNADPLSGQYHANMQGDELLLGIHLKSGTSYIGTMTDSHQKYALILELSDGRHISGTAKEYSLGLQFEVEGIIDGERLPLTFSFTLGDKSEQMKVDFIRDGSELPASTETDHINQLPALPKDATHPRDLIGTWTKEELYNSGYGDNYMGAGFSQSMTFLSNGQLSDGGSSATMSGSNYSGQSSGQGSGVIPGVKWYTIGNQLYMQVTENGQTQEVHLGRYYIENGNMLITGTNGEKILLKKQ